jgi:hypothetical protein
MMERENSCSHRAHVLIGRIDNDQEKKPTGYFQTVITIINKIEQYRRK